MSNLNPTARNPREKSAHKSDINSNNANHFPPKILQQIEFVEKPYIITEYKTYTYWCEHCQVYHQSYLPPEVKNGGLFGKQLLAHTAYMKGQLHTSYRLLKKYFHDIFDLDVSTGHLTRRLNNGHRCPAERLNGKRYANDWLQNLLIATSICRKIKRQKME